MASSYSNMLYSSSLWYVNCVENWISFVRQNTTILTEGQKRCQLGFSFDTLPTVKATPLTFTFCRLFTDCRLLEIFITLSFETPHSQLPTSVIAAAQFFILFYFIFTHPLDLRFSYGFSTLFLMLSVSNFMQSTTAYTSSRVEFSVVCTTHYISN